MKRGTEKMSDNNRVLISVIMPVYNTQKKLEKTK